MNRKVLVPQSFSVLTHHGCLDSLEWGWGDHGNTWVKSSKDSGCACSDDGPMQDIDIEPLLKKFGLIEVYADKPWPPLELLQHMSPAELVATRRDWEQKHGVPKLEVVSDCPGAHHKAELVGTVTSLHLVQAA